MFLLRVRRHLNTSPITLVQAVSHKTTLSSMQDVSGSLVIVNNCILKIGHNQRKFGNLYYLLMLSDFYKLPNLTPLIYITLEPIFPLIQYTVNDLIGLQLQVIKPTLKQ